MTQIELENLQIYDSIKPPKSKTKGVGRIDYTLGPLLGDRYILWVWDWKTGDHASKSVPKDELRKWKKLHYRTKASYLEEETQKFVETVGEEKLVKAFLKSGGRIVKV